MNGAVDNDTSECIAMRDIEDLAYDLYKALDSIMWRAPQLPDSETKPAQAAMDAYEKWAVEPKCFSRGV